MSRTQKAVYALYHGDEFIVMGTIKEIAKYRNIKESSVKFYSSPVNKKRANNKGYILIKVDEDE